MRSILSILSTLLLLAVAAPGFAAISNCTTGLNCGGGGSLTLSCSGDVTSCSSGSGTASCTETTTTTENGVTRRTETTKSASCSNDAVKTAITRTVEGEMLPGFFNRSSRSPRVWHIEIPVISTDDKHTLYDVVTTSVELMGHTLTPIALHVAPPARNEKISGVVKVQVELTEELLDTLESLPVGRADMRIVFFNQDLTRFVGLFSVNIKERGDNR